jgi:protein involved in polysaccharide export with SLBB domain
VTVLGAIAGATPTDEASSTRRMSFANGDSVRTLLERAGGVGPLADLTGAYIIHGQEVIAVDLNALLVLRDMRADRPIELGDRLVVPFKRGNILVEGAVFRPGPYPYNPTFGIEQYVALAGGPNRFARSMGDVRVINPRGEMKNFVPNLKVEPGSSVIVPERNFSRSEIVQIVLGATGIVLSGVAIALAAN